jgi:hypothetical protein
LKGRTPSNSRSAWSSLNELSGWTKEWDKVTAMRIMSPGTALRILCGTASLIVSLALTNSAPARASVSGDVKMSLRPRNQEGNIIEITGRPLRILVGTDASLQVYHEKYIRGATFGTAGSGFFIAVGQTVYGPSYSPFTLIRQAGPSGSGTSASPFQVVMEGQINGNGLALMVVQTISYINGNNHFQLEWEIANNGTGTSCFKAYHAADLYFADNDYGFGYSDSRSGAVGGFNQARDWFMVFIPSPRATHYEEAHYATIWERVRSAQDLQDTIDTAYLDNGAALQWDACLKGGKSTAIGDRWSFGVSEAEVIRPGGIIEGFREPGVLTPEITTYIPTPLDISFDPIVIGSNLLLAALAMIVFTIASAILNRTLAGNEVFLQRMLKPLNWMRGQTERLSISKRLGRPVWFELLKLILVVLIYGFVFSLLERSWNPFSLTGLYLFLTMVIAYGFVGLADDIVQWVIARNWKLPSSLTVRPGNLLIIIASTAFSRVFGILPGIMFGTPEAFDIDAAALKNRRTENALLRVAAGVLFLILFSAWLPTMLTALFLRGSGPEFLMVLIGGLESFLLLIFAVTVQNIFLQMLALPNTFGRALARWNKPVWAIGFLAATFLFLHTLLNPRGGLAEALTSANVQFFLITISLFLVFTVMVWLFFLIANAVEQEPVDYPPVYPSAPPSSKKSTFRVWCLLIAIAALCLCTLTIVWIVVFALLRKG